MRRGQPRGGVLRSRNATTAEPVALEAGDPVEQRVEPAEPRLVDLPQGVRMVEHAEDRDVEVVGNDVRVGEHVTGETAEQRNYRSDHGQPGVAGAVPLDGDADEKADSDGHESDVVAAHDCDDCPSDGAEHCLAAL